MRRRDWLRRALVWSRTDRPSRLVVQYATTEAFKDPRRVVVRGNFLYNLQDESLRRFNAEVPVVAQWDDHEVRNNWFPSQVLDDPRYQVKSVGLLAARAKKSFLEYIPLRLPADDRERVYRKIAYGPNLDVSSSTCAPTEARTRPTGRPP